MTTKKTERIMYYNEKERRWMVETMELEEEITETSQTSDKEDDKTENYRALSYM